MLDKGPGLVMERALEKEMERALEKVLGRALEKVLGRALVWVLDSAATKIQINYPYCTMEERVPQS